MNTNPYTHFVIGAISSSIVLLLFNWIGFVIPPEHLAWVSIIIMVFSPAAIERKYPLIIVILGSCINNLVSSYFLMLNNKPTLVYIAVAGLWIVLTIPFSLSLYLVRDRSIVNETAKKR